MEPEHEIFFLGWRAHGLRAVECTTISILHHGWCGFPLIALMRRFSASGSAPPGASKQAAARLPAAADLRALLHSSLFRSRETRFCFTPRPTLPHPTPPYPGRTAAHPSVTNTT